MFADRSDAGERLADLVVEQDASADVVLAVPRGGLPVGRAVADALGASLDVVVARKLGAPWNEELAVGAVASDGSVWLNDDVVRGGGVSEEYLEREREQEAEAAREKLRRYRGDRPPLDLAGKSVVVVDDGVATGATISACLRQVRAAGAERVALAVPVAPPETVERLRGEVDDVYVVETPWAFGAVGQFYRNFRQVSDEEALSFLEPE